MIILPELMKFKITILFCLFMHVFVAQIDYLQKARVSTNLDSTIFYLKMSWNNLKNTNKIDDIINTQRFLLGQLEIANLTEQSDKYLDTFYVYAKDKKNNRLLANYHNILGTLEKSKRNYAKALENLYKSLDFYTRENDNNGVFACYVELIETNRVIGKFDEVSDYIIKADQLIQKNKLSKNRLIGFYYGRVAAYYNETSKHRKSIPYSLKSIDFNVSTQNYNHIGLSYNELGFSYKNLNIYDSAEYYYKKSIEIYKSSNLDEDVILPLNNLALLYIQQKKPFNQTAGIFKEIINIKNKTGVDIDLYQAYDYLKNEYTKTGNFEKAYYYYDLFHRELYRRDSLNKNAALEEVKEKYENKKIKEKVKEANDKLNLSNEKFLIENKSKKIILVLLLVLVVFIAIVLVLLIQRNKTNALLADKNKAKDALIQEIHHRVKNNLQFISSLINMQLNVNNDEIETRTLNETSRRIKSMSLVHEMLYNQSNENSLNIKQYLTELTHTINDMVNIQNKSINFDLKVQDFYFKTTQAISLGMITSELVSNAIKYAFSNIQNPIIEIILTKNSDGEFEFLLKDNGVGFTEKSDKSNRLGMRLIDIFSRQLGGKYEFLSNEGLCFKLNFKEK